MSFGSSARVMRITPSTLTSNIQRHFVLVGLRDRLQPERAARVVHQQPARLDLRRRTASTDVGVGDVELERRERRDRWRRPPLARRSTRRAPSTTSKPAAASWCAAASPMPLDAPVTTAVPRAHRRLLGLLGFGSRSISSSRCVSDPISPLPSRCSFHTENATSRDRDDEERHPVVLDEVEDRLDRAVEDVADDPDEVQADDRAGDVQNDERR